MNRLACLLVFLCGVVLVHAAPAPWPRRERSAMPPATEVVVTLIDGMGLNQHVEISVGWHKHVIRNCQTWGEELNAYLRGLRADPKTPPLLIVVCDGDELTPSVYITFVRACRTAGFAKVQMKEVGKSR